MIQAVAFDLDDTLLRDDRSISAYTVDVLRRVAALGIHVIPASGRVRESMRPYVDQLACASCYISGNGAEIYAPDHTLLVSRQLSVELAREAAQFAAEHDCYAQSYEDGDFIYSRSGQWADAYARSARLRGVKVDDLVSAIRFPTPKVLLIDSPQRIAELLPKAQERFAGRMTVTCSKPIYMEIVPPEASKGNALAWVSQRLGFQLENTMAFGDSLNDLSMLTAAGHGVAMGNARSDVKSLLSHTCPNNEEDGVARYLEQHILT